MFRFSWIATLLFVSCSAARAEPVVYEIDPSHTYPSFEADHLGGLSVWRGKFNRSAGTVTLDRELSKGQIDVVIDVTSIDFGHEEMNAHAAQPDFFDSAKYPKAHYKGTLQDFSDGMPSRAVGELTLRGVSKPLNLEIKSFKCMPHPMLKRELCGADAYATLQRDAFGIDAGKDYGFSMEVILRIQIEAIAKESAGS
jgi:polyisoprenoid-binding protein YceI